MTNVKQKSYIFTAAKISGILLLICAVIAGVVSLVYSVTIDAYNANVQTEIDKNLRSIFDASEQDEFVSSVKEEGNDYTIYAVTKNGEVGYCIQIEGKGFGGAMTVMVGYHADKSIRGVTVVSHAETPGIGTKALDPARLEEQYEGKSGELTLSKSDQDDVLIQSGATVSSKGIHEAINRANTIIENID